MKKTFLISPLKIKLKHMTIFEKTQQAKDTIIFISKNIRK